MRYTFIITDIFLDLILLKTQLFSCLNKITSLCDMSDKSFNSDIKNNNLSISKEVIIIARIKRTIITGPPLSKKSNRDVKGRVK